MKIPVQYNRLMPYLIIPDAAGFRTFAEEVFGATVQHITMRTEELIAHGELRIGDAVIMFADATDEFTAKPAGLFIYVDSVQDTYKKAIAAGATSVMEPTEQPYGLTCGFKDAFGNDWWPTEAESLAS